MRNRYECFPGALLSAATAAIFFLLPSFARAQANGVAPRITAAIDETHLTTLRGNTHPLANAANDRGQAPGSLPMERMLLVLERSSDQESALELLMEQQQDASSPNFHKWLTPQQFGQQFGPSDQDIQTITSWLQSHGFQVAGMSNGRTVIEFSGTAGQVQEAFHTVIHKYSINGEEHWANSSDPQIPAALTPVVIGVNTLHNFPRQQMHEVLGVFSRTKATGAVEPVGPLFTFPSSSGCGAFGLPNCYALVPADFAKIYSVPNLLLSPAPTTQFNGDGVTIAVVGQSDINPADISQFRALYGLPAPKLNMMVSGPDPGTNGAETEADLDIQWAGAVAPNATIDFVIAEDTEASLGVDLAAQYAVDNNLAAVLNESFGVCEFFMGTADNAFYNELWQQAAAQGTTVTVSAGDSGSAVCDRAAGTNGPAQLGLSVSGFSSTPYNIAVGGTDFNDVNSISSFWNTTPSDTPTVASAKGYIPEVPWNATCTNQEVFSVFSTTTAEQTCNNPQVTQDNSFLLVPVGGSGGRSSCTTSNFSPPLSGTGNLSSCAGGYAKPPWQTGAGVPSDGKRDVPDVSLFASNGFNSSFYLICESDLVPGETSCDPNAGQSDAVGIGGTSASSPAFAGIMALVNQATGSRQGNANYILYKLAAQPGSSCTSAANPASTCVFYDIPSGSTIAMPCVSGSPNCNVNTQGDSIGVLSGFATTSGYDLATGLGSVNANNLVTKWKNFALTPSSTTLSLNSGAAINITHGQPVNVNIGVTGAVGTPTGSASLIANTAPPAAPAEVTQQGLQAFTLTNGAVSSSTSLLPGGTYTVFAQYPGDGTFGASNSTPPVSVTIASESSKTFANLVTLDNTGAVTSFSATNFTYGNGFSLLRIDVGDSTAIVSATTGISSKCSAGTANCPTGNVALTLNGAQSNLALNIQGYAENQSTLSPGTYTGSASYSGDPSYGASSAAVNFTVAKAPTTAQAAVVGTPVQYGDDDEISAAVLTTSDGAAPTGTFSFTLDGAPLSPTIPVVYEGFPYNPRVAGSFANLNGTTDAVFLSLGTHQLVVEYSGDSNYSPSTSPAASFTVTQALPFFTTFGASPNSINLNASVTLSAQMSGSDAGVAPTGTMTFSDGGKAISGTISYTPTAHGLIASMQYTPSTAGSHSITVSYSGDVNYQAASTPSPAPLTVIGPDYTIGPSGAATQTVPPGQTATFSNAISVSPVDGFSGTVNISCSLVAQATSCSVNPPSLPGATGTASVTVTTMASGSLPMGAPNDHLIIRPQVIAALLLEFLVLMAFLSRMRTRRPQAGPAVWVLFAVLALTLGATLGCGGGGGSNPPPPPQGTQPGTYQITIMSSSGSLSHNTTLTLIVN